MTIENTDPRLTAYALNEMQGEEREEFVAELAADELARAELESILEASALLEQELGKPSGLELGARHLERITSALEQKKAPQPKRGRRWAAVSLAATFAALAAFAMLASRTRPNGLADEEATPTALYRSLSKYESASRASAAPITPLELAPEPTDTTPGRERFDQFEDNPFVRVKSDPRSTFSIDVDTASYSLVRSSLERSQLPPKGAVRIEELVNYFKYSYPEPRDNAPFSLSADVASAPWALDHRLLRIGLKARHVSQVARPAANLVFLIDVSGSMAQPNKLPLVKEGLSMLARQLDVRDRLSIVVYAGASGLVLPPTSGVEVGEIMRALDRLEAGGSTNGGQGIELAYATAARNFVPGGVNRVILATDGDFNVGVTNQDDLVELVQRKAKSGVFLSVLGFGRGNYQDSTLEKLADKGNGNYAYIDDRNEARKVLVEQASGTLITVAKDVKIQLEFNPVEVEAFRLIGYENRALAHRDFGDDRKDAGEIGADHTVTALYELVPTTSDELSEDLLQIKLRYKLPDGDTSRLIELGVKNSVQPLTGDFRFAAAVAEFGMLLRDSPHKGGSSYAGVLELATGASSGQEARGEFIELVRKARALTAAER
jgi:Ca-activated chloride channel homolog